MMCCEQVYCMEPVNLLVTIDHRYVEPLLVMLDSYGDCHQGVDTRLFVAHASLDKTALDTIRACAERNQISLRDIRVTERWFADTPVLARLPEESFYRLMAFHYLPEEVGRCLYLDPDIIIRRPLLPLYTEDLEGNYIAAASHTWGLTNRFNLVRLGMRGKGRYLNSGVMVMDLALIRRDFSAERVLESLRENLQRLWLGDQDLINILFGGKAKVVDARLYNLDERVFWKSRREFDLDDVTEQTAIIHYNGKYKPWLEGYKGMLDCFYPAVKEKEPAPTGRWGEKMRAFHRIVRLTAPQRAAVLCAAVFILSCVLGWVLFGKRLLVILEEPALFQVWLDGFGPFDELAFILIRGLQTVIKFIPAEPLEIASGYAWGAIPGMLYCVIGNLLGTLVILWLTRRYGRRFAETFISARTLDKFSQVGRADKMYMLLFLLYLIPGAPKDGFTYIVGLLPVKTLPFLLISFAARMPSVLSSTVCGVALAEKQYLLSLLILALTLLCSIAGGVTYKIYHRRHVPAVES